MAVQHPLDLGGVDVLPAADDHVFDPVGDLQVSAVIEHA